MNYLEDILKRTGWSSLLTSVIFAVLGIVLIINPVGTIRAVSYIIGTIFIVAGAYRIVNYISNKGKYDFYNYDMLFGIIAILIGIATICFSDEIGRFFGILIGIWIIYSSVIRIDMSFKLKIVESKVWLYSLIIAIAMLIAGIYIICNSGVIVVTIGVVILVYAILDIIESAMFLGNINKIK